MMDNNLLRMSVEKAVKCEIERKIIKEARKYIPNKQSHLWACFTNISWEVAKENKDLHLYWTRIYQNKEVDWEKELEENMKLDKKDRIPIDWMQVSKNVSWKFVKKHPDWEWNWRYISEKEDLSWEEVEGSMVVKNGKKVMGKYPFDWKGLAANKNITLEIIRQNKDWLFGWRRSRVSKRISEEELKQNMSLPEEERLPLDWKGLSENENIRWEFILENSDWGVLCYKKISDREIAEKIEKKTS